MADGDGDTFNIKTVNQSGGLVAGKISVNLQAGWRDITEEPKFQSDLLQALGQYKNNRIRLQATMGDSEAITFAEQIIQFLQGHGFDVKPSPNQAVTHPPYKAVQLGGVDESSGDYQVFIGNQHNT